MNFVFIERLRKEKDQIDGFLCVKSRSMVYLKLSYKALVMSGDHLFLCVAERLDRSNFALLYFKAVDLWCPFSSV